MWVISDLNLHIYVQNTIQATGSATCAHTSRDDVSENMWFSLKFYRAFSVAGPIVWNSLPDHLRDPALDSEQLRRELKMYLFDGH